MPIELTITNAQKVRLHATPKTASGKPLPDPVAFAVQSGTCTLVPVDAQTVDIFSGDDVSDSVISATDGAVSDTATVHVVAEAVAAIDLVADAPEPK